MARTRQHVERLKMRSGRAHTCEPRALLSQDQRRAQMAYRDPRSILAIKHGADVPRAGAGKTAAKTARSARRTRVPKSALSGRRPAPR